MTEQAVHSIAPGPRPSIRPSRDPGKPTGGAQAPKASESPKMGLSVGTKLAAMTMVVLAAVSAIVYAGLTEREKENLFNAKAMAGEMVAALFSQSVSAALVFEDVAGLADPLAYLGRNDEVLYAGVWGKHPEAQGKVGERASELRRDGDTADHGAPQAVTARTVAFKDDRLVIEDVVKDTEGETVGYTMVVFSLAREMAMFAELKTRILTTAVGVALLVLVLLIFATRFFVVRRLARLVSAAEQLEKGQTATIDRDANDEVGLLAGALANMAAAILEREKHIQSQNKDMRMVLDNVAQGFVAIDRDGRMGSERSTVLKKWLGSSLESDTLWSYVGRVDAKFEVAGEMGWEACVEGLLPLQLNIEQMPSTLTDGTRTWQVNYRPIVDEEGEVQQCVVVLTDVTSELAHQARESEQKELLNVFRRIMTDRGGFSDFVEECQGLVTRVHEAKEELAGSLRAVHTLKGNSAIYGLHTVAELCHQVEEEVAESGEMTEEHKERIANSWEGAYARVRELLGTNETANDVTVTVAELDDYVRKLQAGASSDELVRAVQHWRYDRVEQRLGALATRATSVAARLGKTGVTVDVMASDLRMPADKMRDFWSSAIHLVRNAVDHGIESDQARSAAGKGPGRISLAVNVEGQAVVFRFADDGAGIDWERVRTKAAQAGLPCSTQDDLVAALMSDGLSTRDVATDTSGRGVGMSAVLEAVEALGGRIAVTSTQGKGTEFEITFGLDVLEDEPSAEMKLASGGE